MAITLNSTPLVCLDSAREFYNLDPLKFNFLDVSGCNIDDSESICSEFWVQNTWNDSHVARELLARRLCECEELMRNFIGTFTRPKWTSDTIRFPEFWMREKSSFIWPQLQNLQLLTENHSVIEFGQQSWEFISNESVTYIDRDGDGFAEVANIHFIAPASVTSVEELKLFFSGHEISTTEPDTVYEVCPIISANLDTGTNTVTLEVYSWNLVDPGLYVNASWGNPNALDACGLATFVPDIEVWREYNDPCKPQAEVIWYEDQYCGPDCAEVIHPACVRTHDLCEGMYSLSLVDYDTTLDPPCVDNTATPYCPPSWPPDRIKVYYKAGMQSKVVDSALFKLTASKFLIPSGCECKCVVNAFAAFSQDTSIIDRQERFEFRYPSKFRMLSPFGTEVGAIQAYITLKQFMEEYECRS